MATLLSGIAAALLLTMPAMAEPPAAEGTRDFAAVKQRRLAKIDAMRACVAKSTNFEEMKACKPERKAKPGL
jgi:hypothetical protein